MLLRILHLLVNHNVCAIIRNSIYNEFKKWQSISIILIERVINKVSADVYIIFLSIQFIQGTFSERLMMIT